VISPEIIPRHKWRQSAAFDRPLQAGRLVLRRPACEGATPDKAREKYGSDCYVSHTMDDARHVPPPGNAGSMSGARLSEVSVSDSFMRDMLAGDLAFQL
jgi:hypothetical protein